MIRIRQLAFALVLVAPLAWAAATAPPFEAAVEAQSQDCLIGVNCPALIDVTGNGPTTDDIAISPSSFGLKSVDGRIASGNVMIPTPWNNCGPTDRTIGFSNPDASNRVTKFCRTDKFGRQQCFEITGFENGLPTGFSYEQRFPNGNLSGSGQGNLKDMNQDGVFENIQGTGQSGFGTPFNLSVNTVQYVAPMSLRGKAPVMSDRYQTVPWATLAMAGHGIVDNSCYDPRRSSDGRAPAATAGQILIPVSQNGQLKFDLDNDGQSDGHFYNSNSTATNTTGRWDLGVRKIGNGRVTSAPVGIDCGPKCFAGFDQARTIRLTPQPDPGWTFKGWSSDVNNPDCLDGDVQLSNHTTCTATFEMGTTPPAPPAKNLNAKVEGFDVRFWWDPQAIGMPPFSLKAGTSPGVHPFVFPVGDQPVFKATAPQPGGTYYVVVNGTQKADGPPSDEIMVTFPGPLCNAAPDAPTNLAATVAGRLVTLNWTESNTGCFARSFKVRYGFASGATNNVLPAGGGTTFGGIVSGQLPATFFVVVTALNPPFESADSNEINFTVIGPITDPPSVGVDGPPRLVRRGSP